MQVLDAKCRFTPIGDAVTCLLRWKRYTQITYAPTIIVAADEVFFPLVSLGAEEEKNGLRSSPEHVIEDMVSAIETTKYYGLGKFISKKY